MSGLQSLYNLLQKRVDLSCSVAAQEFLSSMKSENDRLSLATNGLVPLLENGNVQDSLRIFAAYLLYAIYNFSGTPNPFYSRIAEHYAIQRKQSISVSLNEEPSFYAPSTSRQQIAQLDRSLDGVKYLNIRKNDNSHKASTDGLYSRYSDVPESPLSHPEGSRSPLAWVLWKILRGEAEELDSFSPTTLADIRLWESEGYQRRTDLSLSFNNVLSPQPSQSHVINDFRRIPMHITPPPSTLSSRSPFISQDDPALLEDRRTSLKAVTPSDRYYPAQGYGISTVVGDATARPSAQKTNLLVAPGSSRPSSVAYPSHPSPSSASSTLDSSSINTPNSFVETFAFALPRSDSTTTRVVDASAFYIPQVNRWSTRSEVEVASGPKDIANVPHRVARQFSPTIAYKQSQSARNPGVIGSGRPSSRGPSESSSERSAESRASYIGIAGNSVAGRYSPALEGLDIQSLTLKQSSIPPVARDYPDASSVGGTLLYKTGDGNITPSSDYHDSALNSQGPKRHFDPIPASIAMPQASAQSRSQLYSTSQDGVTGYSTRKFNSQASREMRRDDFGDAEDKQTLTGEETVSTKQSGTLANTPEGRRMDPQRELGQSFHGTSPQSSPNTHVELPTSQGRQNDRAEPNPVAMRERDGLADAIVLYLMARDRVLTLQEQRKLQPHLSMLTRPICVLRPEDISPLVANNQDIAVKLLLSLLSQDEKEARQIEELLKNIDLNHNNHAVDGVDLSMNSLALVSEMVKLVTSYGSGPPPSVNGLSPLRGALAIRRYLVALAELPPTIQSFNVIGRLLSPSQSGQPPGEESRRIAILIRTEVLGGFISGCIRWIERADRDEREGSVHDDRVATATGNLCRFYTALIRYGMIAADSEEDTTEIMSFALQFSRFESAQSLYSILASARA